MKKLITLLILFVGMVSSASADGEIYLRNNIAGWDTDNNSYKSEKKWDSSGNQDIYEFTISGSVLGSNDFYFRINRYNSDGNQVGPYNHVNYTYTFPDGATETYTAPRIAKFQGTGGAFCIKHSEIKANEYKITIYLKYHENPTVDATVYNDVWVYYIKVDIVNMPVTIGSTGKATFSCDRALDFTGKGISANMITGVSGVALTTTPVTKVPANTGLYLEGSEGTVNVPVVSTSAAEGVVTSANMLRPGTGAAISQIDGSYTNFILTTNKGATPKFFKVNSAGNTVAAGKAYLQILSKDVGAHEYFWFEDETTGIEAAKATQKMNGEFFNLAGQRVAQPAKGLYIVNGKKVIMK